MFVSLTPTRWDSLEEQELLTLLEHPSSPPPPVFIVIRVAESLVLCVVSCRKGLKIPKW